MTAITVFKPSDNAMSDPSRASITPFAEAASPIYANSGYLPAGDYWRLGTIFGAIFLGVLLLLGVPWPEYSGRGSGSQKCSKVLIQDGFAGGELPSRFIL